jgi:hypothetical protein
LNQFGNNARYDIKKNMQEMIGDEVVLCGIDGCAWVDYSTPGNILYGYLSGERGIPQGISLVAAGARQILDGESKWEWYKTLGEDPRDKAAVDFGYSLYQKYPEGITTEQFQAELTQSVLQSFQPPDIMPASTPLPQENMYPPGIFLNP